MTKDATVIKSPAWHRAVELTAISAFFPHESHGKKGFKEPKLPLEWIAQFQIDYRPAPRIQNRMGDGFVYVDHPPERLLKNFSKSLKDSCEAGLIPYEVVKDPYIKIADVYLITSADFAAWLNENSEEPSVHIKAWFRETKVTPVKKNPSDPREIESLLKIIALLCKEANIDFTRNSKAAVIIQSMAKDIELSLGETTVERHLQKISKVFDRETIQKLRPNIEP